MRLTLPTRQRGFTLIELMIVLVISAIVLAWGVPSFQTMLRNNRVTTATNLLISSLQTARSEAVKRSISVSICHSTDPQATNPTCDTSTNGFFDSGWIVFVDRNANGSRDTNTNPALDDTVLSVYVPPTGVSVRSDINSSSPVKNAVTYNATALLRLGSGQAISTARPEFVLCAKANLADAIGTANSSVPRRRLDLSTIGSVSSLRDDETSCTPN